MKQKNSSKPLSASELTKEMVRELNEAYLKHLKEEKSLARRDFVNFLRSLQTELSLIEDVESKLIEEIELSEENLGHLEVFLKKYKGKLEKDLDSKPMLTFIKSLLLWIRKIKKEIKEDKK